jgi:hypothetical protein
MEFFTHLDGNLLYIGPGMGGGIIAAVLGIVFAFFLSLIAILWKPIKKIIRFFKSKE